MPLRPAQPRTAAHLRLVTPAPAAISSLRPRAPSRPALPGPRGVGDWAWHGLGVGVATASAGFAAYALVFSTGEVVPSGNFNIFARYDRIYQGPAARRGGAPDTATAAAPESASPDATRRDLAKSDAVDFTPTGSLAGSPDQAPGDGRPETPGGGRGGAEGRLLPNFKLRDVFDGKALVESRSSLSVVKPGSVLEGAGEVLSIEKRGEHWVVLTQNGLIAAQRR